MYEYILKGQASGLMPPAAYTSYLLRKEHQLAPLDPATVTVGEVLDVIACMNGEARAIEERRASAQFANALTVPDC